MGGETHAHFFVSAVLITGMEGRAVITEDSISAVFRNSCLLIIMWFLLSLGGLGVWYGDRHGVKGCVMFGLDRMISRSQDIGIADDLKDETNLLAVQEGMVGECVKRDAYGWV